MQVIRQLGTIYAPGSILTDPRQLRVFECDGLASLRGRPLAAVFPTTTEQVAATLKLCYAAGVPFVARGSGTSLSGGAVPPDGSVVVALNRMNRILALEPENLRAIVQPGVINAHISRAAAPFGLHYAPDPSSQIICTIGGNIAFNSGGAHCLKYGMTSNHILGLKVVLPDGEIARLDGGGLEPIGPDWTGFFVGSEGLFGIAVEATVRLVPKPEAAHTVLAAYRSLEAAGEAVAAVVESGLLPAAMEIMDALIIEAAEAAVGAGYPRDAAGLLIVELDGTRKEVAAESARLQQIIAASGAYAIRSAAGDAERLTIWKGRKSAFSAVGRLSPDYIVGDGVVPRARLGEALRRIQERSRSYGLRVANVFHAGDGNLHPLVLFDGREPGAHERAEQLAGEILSLCIELGGSITGEHGVGLEKRAYLEAMFGADDVEAMRRIRRAIDPKELANRGKMFPDALEQAPGGRAPDGVRGAAPAPPGSARPTDRRERGIAL
ncbi:MAG TPA: FAD-linked oxidase C-terminal domain-containing protein [Limnochordia bacterium]|nr:FAD-linked oxidase C-terminal domain-containing protein [Limnochordia bacterium]